MIALLLLPVASVAAASYPTGAPVQGQLSSSGAKTAQAIPLADIATQAAATAGYVSSLSALLEHDAEISAMTGQLNLMIALINQDRAELKDTVREAPTLGTLRDVGRIWWKRKLQLTQWLNVLTRRAERLQSVLARITALQKSWQVTAADQASRISPQIVRQAEDLQAALSAAQTSVEQRRSEILAIQDTIARQIARCDSILSRLDRSRQDLVRSLVARVAPPLWRADLRVLTPENLRARLGKYGEWYRSDLTTFTEDPPHSFQLQWTLFLGLLGLFIYMRLRVRKFTQSEQFPPEVGFLEFPLSAALAGALNFGASQPLLYPTSVWMLMQSLSAIPMIRMLRPIISRRMAISLYALAALFIFDTLRQGLAGIPSLDQVMLLTEAVLGIVVFRFLLVDIPPTDNCAAGTAGRNQRLERALARGALITLAVSVAATFTGLIVLAQLCVSAVFGGGIFVLTFVTFIRVTTGIVGFFLRSWPCNTLLMVRHYRGLLEERSRKVIYMLAVVTGLGLILHYVGLLNDAVQILMTVLSARLDRGGIAISVGDIVAFGFAIGLAYLMASLICFVLNEDVFPRTQVGPGRSYAVSSLLRYMILVCGVLIGMGLLGVTLNRLVILVSAFGVGIGFGLQTVVNNFISGLILLFERPIRVGDMVEFRSIIGEVSSIGIRSSKVHTPQGAEIIVPNSQLVTESVTNWTLSDEIRRIELQLVVNAAADPQQVIDLVQEVARKDPRILATPPGVCFFTGFGEKTGNFELWAWTDHFSDWNQIRSDLAVAVHQVMQKAGMLFASPQK